MPFFPSETFTVETNKSREEILDLLKCNTMQKKVSDFVANDFFQGKPFSGEIEESGFRLKSCFDAYGTFMPEIIGKITEFDNNSLIEINLKIFSSSKKFTIFMLVFFMCFYLFTNTILIISHSFVFFVALFPLIFPGFIYLIMTCTFCSQSKKIKKRLAKLFGA